MPDLTAGLREWWAYRRKADATLAAVAARTDDDLSDEEIERRFAAARAAQQRARSCGATTRGEWT